jgi:hypothetical protein
MSHVNRLAVALYAVATLASADSLIQVNRRAQVSRADLDYDAPAARPEEGIPLGNGRMGSLLWTTPSAVKLQINRVDLHAMDDTSFSFARADSDYGYGCGYIDINLVQAGPDVFGGKPFRQHLSVYDALMSLQGSGVSVRAVASPASDVMAIEIDDQRAQPEPINIDLRMLRYQMQFTVGKTWEQRQNHTIIYRTAAHTATSILGIRDGRVTLVQQFREGSFYDSSAVGIAVSGRPSRARYLNDSTVQLSATAARGRFTIWIGSAESRAEHEDVAALVLRRVDGASGKSFDTIREETAAWWHDFWSRGMVYMHSASGQADFVDQNYTYYLYLMGSSSRGKYPPRFGGLIWQTDGDMARWGSQYWWANTSAYYTGLMPANRLELMDPFFSLYLGMLDAAATAARQQWGSEGIYIPEITAFSGPEKLPDDIAKELQDLMLARKPFEQRSAEFDRYAQNKNRHTSRWNYRNDGDWDHGYYVFKSKGSGIFGHTTHILGVATRLGNLAWQRYQLTQNMDWLRGQAYPIIKGAAEFYRHFPNLRKDERGIYHIEHTNSGESSWDSRDAPYEVQCLHLIFPLAIRAAETLGVDADLRAAWKEIDEHLVPMGGTVRGQAGGPGRGPFGSFVYAGPGAIAPIGPEPDIKVRFLGFTRLGSFIDDKGIGGAQIFRNRLRLREGPGAIDFEHLAGLTAGVHTSLLDSHPESVTDREPVRVFAEWPKDWDAAFTLLARGGFLVSSAQQNGSIPLIEAVSQYGGELRLANPWGEAAVTIYRNGRKAEDASGAVVTVKTAKGETIVIVPQGGTPAPARML